MRYLLLILKGTAIGAANIIPGISGATLAVMLRIYDTLINSVNDLFKQPKKSLKFLIPIAVGMAVGILALGSFIDIMFTNFPAQAAAFIIGLMAAGLLVIYKQAFKKSEAKSKGQIILYLALIIAAVVAINLLGRLTPDSETLISPTLRPGFLFYVFIGGVLAAATMIIPGVSGALVFILMGLYPLIIATVSDIRVFLTSFDFDIFTDILLVVAPIGVGIIVGVVLCSKFIAFLLKRFYSGLYAVIIGLIIGSMILLANEYSIFANFTTPLHIVTVIAAAILGALPVVALGIFTKKTQSMKED